MRGLFGGAVALAAAAAMGLSGQAALVAAPAESVRRLAPVPGRKDRKRRARAALHMRNARARSIRYGESKLRRRLRRKRELGMLGAF